MKATPAVSNNQTSQHLYHETDEQRKYFNCYFSEQQWLMC